MGNAIGLVITGGGARGAYQAGVLKRIGEIPRVQQHGNPFPLIGGASAGAVNGAALAVGADDFSATTKTLANLWAGLRPTDVFHCDLAWQAHNSVTWILDLSFGGIFGGGNARSLLDASPLRNFLSRHLDCDRIQNSIKRGNLYALAISATNYNSGESYLFIQGAKGHPVWKRLRLVTVATKITVDHVCASAAIPLIFQPVRLNTPRGPSFFGDGCVRLQQPLSPVIRLGAEKVFAIGVRGERGERIQADTNGRNPSLSQVMGVLFDAMFLDHIATDVEHLQRLNRLLELGHIVQPNVDENERIRPLSTFIITPSESLSELAAHHQKEMPYLIKYFVRSLGRDAESCADLMSYLLFTSRYTRDLIEIGYRDAHERIEEIEDFLYSSRDSSDNGGVRAKRSASGVPGSTRRK
ncbi:MAG TPA: patatin-like phospholipase family protein [Candidatus Binatia bacterium]|nr:patatin-like phospholipase family protein [Candidatus Binatia bacterium]